MYPVQMLRNIKEWTRCGFHQPVRKPKDLDEFAEVITTINDTARKEGHFRKLFQEDRKISLFCKQ